MGPFTGYTENLHLLAVLHAVDDCAFQRGRFAEANFRPFYIGVNDSAAVSVVVAGYVRILFFGYFRDIKQDQVIRILGQGQILIRINGDRAFAVGAHGDLDRAVFFFGIGRGCRSAELSGNDFGAAGTRPVGGGGRIGSRGLGCIGGSIRRHVRRRFR